MEYLSNFIEAEIKGKKKKEGKKQANENVITIARARFSPVASTNSGSWKMRPVYEQDDCTDD